MKEETFSFEYQVYATSEELNDEDSWLLHKAREVTSDAYAPYSHFRVGAVARLQNQEIVAGSNQENASFPIGLCAERVVLASAASQFPKVAVNTIAVSYHNEKGDSNQPISPCGICRQSLLEYEAMAKHPIRIILGGLRGKVYILSNAAQLLPLSFSADDMRP